MGIRMKWVALLIFFISSSLTSPAFALSKTEKAAQELHSKLKIIDSKLKLGRKLSSILDLEYLLKLNNQELKYIRKAYDLRYKASLAEPNSERVYMSVAFVVDVLAPYYGDLPKYLPESDEERSTLYHRILSLILFTEDNLEDMLTGDGMWVMTPTEYAHLSYQITEAKRHKHEFQKRYGYLDQESIYNIVMPYFSKGIVITIVSFGIYIFGKWHFSRKALPEKADRHEPEERRQRRPRHKGPAHTTQPSSTGASMPQEPNNPPPTEEEIKKRESAKFCTKTIKTMNHILTTEDRSVDEADFSKIGEEIEKLRRQVPREHLDNEILQKLGSVKRRISAAASDFKNILQEDALNSYAESLESYSEET